LEILPRLDKRQRVTAYLASGGAGYTKWKADGWESINTFIIDYFDAKKIRLFRP
jgi:hypothetical protein